MCRPTGQKGCEWRGVAECSVWEKPAGPALGYQTAPKNKWGCPLQTIICDKKWKHIDQVTAYDTYPAWDGGSGQWSGHTHTLKPSPPAYRYLLARVRTVYTRAEEAGRARRRSLPRPTHSKGTSPSRTEACGPGRGWCPMATGQRPSSDRRPLCTLHFAHCPPFSFSPWEPIWYKLTSPCNYKLLIWATWCWSKRHRGVNNFTLNHPLLIRLFKSPSHSPCTRPWLIQI
jgi:hypothetical protein